MSETPPEGTTDTAPTNAELDAKVTALDAKIDTILSKLGGGGGEGAAAEPKQPASVADEIRQQLDERKRADDAAKAAEGDAAWRKNVDDRLAGMTEKTPEPPQTRRERFMWGLSLIHISEPTRP